MLLGSIRSRLLVLVLATVVPFMALVGAGLWSQWREDRAAAVERALNEARLLAAQLDDHISNLENLLAGLSRAVSTDPADTGANDALLRQTKSQIAEFRREHPALFPRWNQYRTSSVSGIGRPDARNLVFLPGRPGESSVSRSVRSSARN